MTGDEGSDMGVSMAMEPGDGKDWAGLGWDR